MDYLKSQQILIDALKNDSGATKPALRMLKRPRKLATKALESDEVGYLTKHLIMVTLWPESSNVRGWLGEIRARLDSLAFSLCKFYTQTEGVTYIKDLWFDTDDIMPKVNQLLFDSYFDVMENLEYELGAKIEPDPFDKNEGQDFSEIGYSLRTEKNKDQGFYFSLWLKGERIV